MEGASTATIDTALQGVTGAAEAVAQNALAAIGTVLPIVAPVMAAIIVIAIVYKVIKKFSK